MTSRSPASPRRSPGRRKSASSPRVEPEWRPEEGPYSYAQYVERRRELLAAIGAEADRHALRMEERAREAVARASAVIQRSRNQEVECLDYIDSLEQKVEALQRARRAAAAELAAYEREARATRQHLDDDLRDAQQRVEAARAEQRAVQTALEQRRAELAEAERSHTETAERQLQAHTASVEERFRRAISVLQAQVQERKAWADAQCAACEERVRVAARRAEEAERGDFLREVRGSISSSSSEGAGREGARPGMAAGLTAAAEQEMRQLEAKMEELAASSGARMQAIVAEQEAAKAQLNTLREAVAAKQRELTEVTLRSQELTQSQSVAETSPRQSLSVHFSDATEAAQREEHREAPVSQAGKARSVSLWQASQSESAMGASASAASFPGAPSAYRELLAAAVATQMAGQSHRAEESADRCGTERSLTASPPAPPTHDTDSTLSPLRSDPAAGGGFSPAALEASGSTAYLEATLVRDMSCSFDAFTAVTPIKRKSVQRSL